MQAGKNHNSFFKNVVIVQKVHGDQMELTENSQNSLENAIKMSKMAQNDQFWSPKKSQNRVKTLKKNEGAIYEQ